MKIGRGCGCFGCFGLVVLFVVVGIAIALRVGYFQWQDSFEGKHLSTDYFIFGSDAYNSALKSVDEKIAAFSKSTKQSDFVEFNVNETLALFGRQFADSLPSYLKLDRMFVETGKNNWLLYVQLTWNGMRLPWATLRLQKDNIQTAQLFVSSLKVGPYSADDFGLKSVRDSINSGIQDSIILVNENEFTGRRFVNIDMDESGVVIKGELNSTGTAK